MRHSHSTLCSPAERSLFSKSCIQIFRAQKNHSGIGVGSSTKNILSLHKNTRWLQMPAPLARQLCQRKGQLVVQAASPTQPCWQQRLHRNPVRGASKRRVPKRPLCEAVPCSYLPCSLSPGGGGTCRSHSGCENTPLSFPAHVKGEMNGRQSCQIVGNKSKKHAWAC